MGFFDRETRAESGVTNKRWFLRAFKSRRCASKKERSPNRIRFFIACLLSDHPIHTAESPVRFAR